MDVKHGLCAKNKGSRWIYRISNQSNRKDAFDFFDLPKRLLRIIAFIFYPNLGGLAAF